MNIGKKLVASFLAEIAMTLLMYGVFNRGTSNSVAGQISRIDLISLVIVIIVLLFGLLTALLTTRSLTRPLAQIV